MIKPQISNHKQILNPKSKIPSSLETENWILDIVWILMIVICNFFKPIRSIRNLPAKAGYTLIEITVALGGIAVLAVVATSFVFSLFSQRDQAIAESIASDQAEAIFAVVGDAIRSAQSIIILNAGKRMELTSIGECFTFEHNPTSEEVLFARSEGDSCVPPAIPTNRLSSQQSQVEDLTLTLVDPDESSRTVSIDLTVGVYRPLWSTNKSFNQAFVNVVDE